MTVYFESKKLLIGKTYNNVWWWIDGVSEVLVKLELGPCSIAVIVPYFKGRDWNDFMFPADQLLVGHQLHAHGQELFQLTTNIIISSLTPYCSAERLNYAQTSNFTLALGVLYTKQFHF